MLPTQMLSTSAHQIKEHLSQKFAPNVGIQPTGYRLQFRVNGELKKVDVLHPPILEGSPEYQKICQQRASSAKQRDEKMYAALMVEGLPKADTLKGKVDILRKEVPYSFFQLALSAEELEDRLSKGNELLLKELGNYSGSLVSKTFTYVVFNFDLDRLQVTRTSQEYEDQFETSCANCHQWKSTAQKLYQCAACKNTLYCSRSCQRQAWKTHAPQCDKPIPLTFDQEAIPTPLAKK